MLPITRQTTPAVRAALRPRALLPIRGPSPAQRLPAAAVRAGYATTTKNREQQERDGIRDEGTSSEFNKDGTSPNKTYFYVGGVTLLIGAVYMWMMGRPDKAGKTAVKYDTMETGKERTVTPRKT